MDRSLVLIISSDGFRDSSEKECVGEGPKIAPKRTTIRVNDGIIMLESRVLVVMI